MIKKIISYLYMRINPIGYARKIGVKIGNRCFVGWGAFLLTGAGMGDNSVLAAGAVLSQKIPAGEIWGGVPAKRIMTVDEFAEKCKQGEGNVFIGSGNKREVLEKYFSGEKHNVAKI